MALSVLAALLCTATSILPALYHGAQPGVATVALLMLLILAAHIYSELSLYSRSDAAHAAPLPSDVQTGLDAVSFLSRRDAEAGPLQPGAGSSISWRFVANCSISVELTSPRIPRPN